MAQQQQLILGRWQAAVDEQLRKMQGEDFSRRFWSKDGTLWTSGEASKTIPGALGWLDVIPKMREAIPELEAFATEIHEAGFERVVLCGMGGSSLAPLVLSQILGGAGRLKLSVLDSTDPGTVLKIEERGPVEKAFFIIASKSGSTAEPVAYDDYFFDKVRAVKGDKAGENFVAITDPGSDLERSAKERGFRRVFLNFADIGGRFSALSYFGLVPAALMDIDLAKLLDRAEAVVKENSADVNLTNAPAMHLGAALGVLALQGSDKLTFLLRDDVASLGLWLEQLIAESTGKEGKGILPIAGEEPGSAANYGSDRVFAYIRPKYGDNALLDASTDRLDNGTWPFIRIEMEDGYDVAAEFMRWEIATGVAGAVLGINAFDQPNVQESKDVTKKLIAQVEQEGQLPVEQPELQSRGMSLYGDIAARSIELAIDSFKDRVREGDFVTLMAYLTESKEMNAELKKLQAAIRDTTKCPCTCGYGPRFLHSTGQFHKGGPNRGHFIQLTADDSRDAALPGRSYTFGQFRNAQALGDRQTLEAHHRNVIRIDLGADPVGGVQMLVSIVNHLGAAARS